MDLSDSWLHSVLSVCIEGKYVLSERNGLKLQNKLRCYFMLKARVTTGCCFESLISLKNQEWQSKSP